MSLRPPVLAFDVDSASLPLCDDVVFTQVKIRRFAEGFFGLNFPVAEFAAQLEIPILGDFLGFGEALFLRARPAVLAAEIAGTLPATAIRALVNVNLAAQDRVLFRHRRYLRTLSRKSRKCERVV